MGLLSRNIPAKDGPLQQGMIARFFRRGEVFHVVRRTETVVERELRMTPCEHPQAEVRPGIVCPHCGERLLLTRMEGARVDTQILDRIDQPEEPRWGNEVIE